MPNPSTSPLDTPPLHMHTRFMAATPNRTMRIPDDPWDAAQATAKARGETVTAVVVQALRRYVKGKS